MGQNDLPLKILDGQYSPPPKKESDKYPKLVLFWDPPAPWPCCEDAKMRPRWVAYGPTMIHECCLSTLMWVCEQPAHDLFFSYNLKTSRGSHVFLYTTHTHARGCGCGTMQMTGRRCRKDVTIHCQLRSCKVSEIGCVQSMKSPINILIYNACTTDI